MLNKLLAFFVLCTASLYVLAQEEPEPYTWANVLTLESLTNLQGGVETGTRNLANLDLSLSVDTAAAGWWNNGTVFMYVLGTYGKPPSELTGEAQTLSNIEAYDNLSLYEFWYEHSFAEGGVKLLVGLHDYNSTFYSLESSGLFTLSSLGIGPEIAQIGPSIFPTTAAAVHLTLSHNDQYFLLAAYDGVPGDPEHPHGTQVKFKKTDGVLTAAEWGFASEKEYKLALGGWKTSAEVENPIDASVSDSNQGYYVIGEKYLSEKLALFFQYGYADKAKNQLETYSGAGVTYSELFAQEDSIGLGYARAQNSSEFLEVNPDFLSAESVFELSYFRPVMEKLSVQTSVYYVEHPGMAAELDNTYAFGLRLYIEL